LDGLVNVYASELLANSLFASGLNFVLVKGDTLTPITVNAHTVTPGHDDGIRCLARDSRNQQDQPFVIITRSISITDEQSLSDWGRTPQKYCG